MEKEISKVYNYEEIQEEIYHRWLEDDAFAAIPDDRENKYVIMMPLPNVTGALHMGHAMDNVMQDLLVRWHRMKGDNTLWMPGTDHAGIATQAVVEKRLYELEGKTRYDIGREALVARIWEWKDQYQQRIFKQLQRMGCSSDWKRKRFTMDKVCVAAVRETFFKMFKDDLIYRGNRLVNWDCQLQTAVSDDEIVYETLQGHFWHIRYPILNPKKGEPEHIVVATTRPETMLGDTAVACHPEPRKALELQIKKIKSRLEMTSGKDRIIVKNKLNELILRQETHLPLLEQLVIMAKDGRKVILPLQNRVIPLITDEWAKPELGSGFVKITPGHDINDYEVWKRHQDEISVINLLNPDGTLNENSGIYAGQDRFVARDNVIKDLQKQNLIEKIEQREVEVGHSDRSKTPIEPYLSQQWFVRMGDVPGGIVCGQGTPNEFRTSGLAQAAMDAVKGDWKSMTGLKMTFHPDSIRYGDTYYNWLSEKRDWCISRQLWWGHRIPIWLGKFTQPEFLSVLNDCNKIAADVSDKKSLWIWINDAEGNRFSPEEAEKAAKMAPDGTFEILLCIRFAKMDAELGRKLKKIGLKQDPDVLDTWFSSALWPHSTLGWPDPTSAEIDEGQRPLKSVDGKSNTLDYYYPGSCLVTGRDIITLWIARMIITGLYNLGDVPFTDSFIHANILDGNGERMSKSKGNGIDPVDIIDQYGADAMRYVLCDMQTGTQDIRLPVQAISPFTGEFIELATAKHGRNIFTYICPTSGKEFDVLGTMPDIPSAKIISDRFDVGKHFCNKLWNASRFTLLNLEKQEFKTIKKIELQLEDIWILSRLNDVIKSVDQHLGDYNPAAAIGAARKFFWAEFCDWYLELIKSRFNDVEQAFVVRQVLAAVLDQILRLFHPFIPFITEAIWEKLNQIVKNRGIENEFQSSDLLVKAEWPSYDENWIDPNLEKQFELMQDVVRAIRNVRSKHNVKPSKKLDAKIKANQELVQLLNPLIYHIKNSANLNSLEIETNLVKPTLSTSTIAGKAEIYLEGVIDPEKEKIRLDNQKQKLNQQISALKKKLSNKNFVNKAPAEIVEKNIVKLDELSKQLETIIENLKFLI